MLRLIQILFIALKLEGRIDWGWDIVLIPAALYVLIDLYNTAKANPWSEFRVNWQKNRR